MLKVVTFLFFLPLILISSDGETFNLFLGGDLEFSSEFVHWLF